MYGKSIMKTNSYIAIFPYICNRIGQRKHCNNESFNTGIMKRMKFIWAICIIVSLCNCSKQQDSSVYVVNVSKDYPELKLNIQDIADVTYLKLETDTGYVTKSRPKCLSENFVAVNGAVQGEVLIFDAHTGSAVSHFANQGNGPHEYLYTNEVHIDEATREVFIHDSFLRKIFVYDFVGNFVREIPAEKSGRIYPFGEKEEFLSYDFDERVKEPEKPSFSILSKADGKLLKHFEVPIAGNVHNLMVYVEMEGGVFAYSAGHLPVVKTEGGYLLNPLSADTIYKYSHEGICEPYIARTPGLASMDDPVYLQAGVETSDYIFLNTVRIDADSEEDMFPGHALVYDKKQRKPYRCKVVNADYPEQEIELDAHVVDHVDRPRCGVIRLHADALLTALEEGKLHGTLKSLAQSLHAEDNDVLMLLKFR